jgi:hypothetical protein
MGVRDALRMVDSFNKWAQRNKERAKDLDDFIHDGLIAAAKRCESCLKDDLGLTFIEGENGSVDEPVPSGYEATSPISEDIKSHTPSETSEDVTLSQSEVDLTIESVGRSADEEMEDISLDGPPREFTSDFELVEPSPLEIDKPEDITPSEEEIIVEKKPSFTWADYEEAVSPGKEEPIVEDDEEEPAIEFMDAPPIDEESTIESVESILIDEPVSLGPPKVLTPSEQPALPTDELENHFEDDDAPPDELDDLEVTDLPEPITEPPPPPPPPESEEDEDERRRRARRLFFGD